MVAEPIAVIGMGCRLPGAPGPDAFWRLLVEGRDAITDVPADRWDARALYSSEPLAPGKMKARRGGFLDNIYGFDAAFFRIMPAEASRIDPQHRLALEVAWEAIEQAAIDPTSLAGSLAGVYMGVSHSDHDRLLYEDPDLIDGRNGPNTYHCFAANRISYFLKLRGPSFAVDGACSSSLAAIHLACQGLRTGDCDLALAGGVNLNLTPGEFIALSHLGVLSGSDRSQPFSDAADGYVRGEGCGVLVLKRLADAVTAQDNILAVIRGSALNHNGLSNGITAPSAAAQEEVIRRALKNAGVDAREVSHVEAMGVGTALGDPIEVATLADVYDEAGEECWISSVKANIGHLEAAAGVASVIKAVICLQHGCIPAQLNVEHINPRIELGATRLSLPRANQPWAGPVRTAAVSAFGFGGANAHLILQEAPKEDFASASPVPSHHLLPISAQSGPALIALAGAYLEFLSTMPEVRIEDVCFTATTGRPHWTNRLAIVAASTSAVIQALQSFREGRPDHGLFTTNHLPGAAPGERRDDDNELSIPLRDAAKAYVSGDAVDWSRLVPAGAHRIPLPSYPFQRLQYRFPPVQV